MNFNYQVKEFSGIITRIREGSPVKSSRILLLLHGWTGDENSMWVFSENIPEDYWVIAPRGLFQAQGKGYSWRKFNQSEPWTPPRMDDFNYGISAIAKLLEDFQTYKGISVNFVDIMGFSQGAAFASALLVSHTIKINKTVLLAGFLPEITKIRDYQERQFLHDKKVFIAHGNFDETVPISKSIRMAELLESMGAEISFCTDEVGHKVGKQCFKGLLEFLEA